MQLTAQGTAAAKRRVAQVDVSTTFPRAPPPPKGIAGLSSGVVAASSFRTYHTALNEQRQFIGALKAARAFSASASRDLGLDVFPYSVFHVFFEQYLTPASDAAKMVGLPCLAVFAAAWAFTGSLWASALLLMMLSSLLVQLGGAMYLAGIQVNAGEQGWWASWSASALLLLLVLSSLLVQLGGAGTWLASRSTQV